MALFMKLCLRYVCIKATACCDTKRKCHFTFGSTWNVEGNWVNALSPRINDRFRIPPDGSEAILKGRNRAIATKASGEF